MLCSPNDCSFPPFAKLYGRLLKFPIGPIRILLWRRRFVRWSARAQNWPSTPARIPISHRPRPPFRPSPFIRAMRLWAASPPWATAWQSIIRRSKWASAYCSWRRTAPRRLNGPRRSGDIDDHGGDRRRRHGGCTARETVRTDQAWRERLPAGCRLRLAVDRTTEQQQGAQRADHDRCPSVPHRARHGSAVRCRCQKRTHAPYCASAGRPAPAGHSPGRITIWESPAPRPLLNGHSGTTGDGCRWHG